MLDHLPLPLLVVVFLACGTVIWFAGIQLSKSTDALDSRLHLGSALGGLIVLAVATNLPELVITITAAASGSVEVAAGNILGGIALQTVVLVILDAFGRRKQGAPPLTSRAASLTLVVEALIVVAVLSVVVAGTQLPGNLHVLRLTPQAVLIVVVWFVGLLLVRRAGKHLPWHEGGRAPDTAAHPQGHRTRASSAKSGGTSGSRTPSLRRAIVVFTAAAVATLVAGFFLEQSGDAASGRLGVSGLLFGATVLALATSLPEISTGLQSIRQGDDDLAVSDIFGGNAFLPTLFLLAGLVSDRAVLPRANSGDIYLTAIAILLTLVYALGLLFRPRRRVLGIGVDSLVVLVLYLLGIAGLVAVAR